MRIVLATANMPYPPDDVGFHPPAMGERAEDEGAMTDEERESLRITATLRAYAAHEDDHDRTRRVLRGETVREALILALMSLRHLGAKP